MTRIAEFRTAVVTAARTVVPTDRVWRSSTLVDGAPAVFVDRVSVVSVGGLLDVTGSVVAIPRTTPDPRVSEGESERLVDDLAAAFIAAGFRLDAINPISEQSDDVPTWTGWQLVVTRRALPYIPSSLTT